MCIIDALRMKRSTKREREKRKQLQETEIYVVRLTGDANLLLVVSLVTKNNAQRATSKSPSKLSRIKTPKTQNQIEPNLSSSRAMSVLLGLLCFE